MKWQGGRFLVVLLIALAKSWSAGQASHQPAYMGSYHVVTHVCPVYLVEERYFRVIF